MLEKAGLDIYYGKLPFPETSKDDLWYTLHAVLENSTKNQRVENIAMSFDKSQKVDQQAVKVIRDVMASEFGPSLEERRETLHKYFGDKPIPKAIVESALIQFGTTLPEFRAIMIEQLAAMRGGEMLSWIEPLLKSPILHESGWGAIALLHIDEARALKEMERLFEERLGKERDPSFSTGLFVDTLKEHGSPDAIALVAKLAHKAKQFHETY